MQVQSIAELEFPPIEYGVTDAAINELRERYSSPDASTDDGYEFCKEGVKELTALRTAIENRRKDLKAPALDWGRNVDSIAKDLIRRIKTIEAPVKAEKERIDDIERAKAREAAEAEQRRVDSITGKIAEIEVMGREQRLDDTALTYADRIDILKRLEINDDTFAEFAEKARTARDAALYKLESWHAAAVEREAEDARLAEERAAIEKQKAELAEREAEANAERQRIELEKAEAEVAERAVEAEKAAKEQARADRITYRIDIIQTIPDRATGMTAKELAGLIESVKADVPDPLIFDEFIDEAKAAHAQSLDRLDKMLAAVRADEEERQRDEQAKMPDKEKLRNWCDTIAVLVTARPPVLSNDAQRILTRYGDDIDKWLTRLSAAIDKL